MDDNPGLSLFQEGGIQIERPHQNQEEEEELEDQIRRQEEIQKLLTKALDDFNYEDSTVNSSTNVSMDESQTNLIKKYREASHDDQLKVLYEVRVRELKTLTEELENLKKEMKHQKDQYMRHLMLSEGEKEQAKMSLQQSQGLLVSKNEELAKLQSDLQNTNEIVKNLQETVKRITEENTVFKHTNQDLMEQLSIIQKGMMTNKITDRAIQEQHQAEITQLHMSLDTALNKLDRKEIECKELEQKLKQKIQEKDEVVVEKSSIINKLTEHLEGSQQQCKELLDVLETLSQENKRLKNANNPNLTESLKMANERNELMKSLQRELEKSQDLQNRHLIEFSNLQQSYGELNKKYKQSMEECDELREEIKNFIKANGALRTAVENQKEEINSLTKELETNLVTIQENQNLERRLKELEKIKLHQAKETQENYAQVSHIFNESFSENEKEQRKKLEQELVNANKLVEELKEELLECNEKLSLKEILDAEREKLVKSLVEKAQQFEKVIKEKQNQPPKVTKAINTENEIESDLLRAKFETELLEKEIEIRLNVKKEFDEKLKEIREELSNSRKQGDCCNCEKLKLRIDELKGILDGQETEIKNLKEARKMDREAVLEMFNEWKEKFYQIERENENLTMKYNRAKKHYDEVVKQMKERDKNEAKLYEYIKKETEEAVKMWNCKSYDSILKLMKLHTDKINEVKSRMEKSSKNTEKEISKIEQEFLMKKKVLEEGGY